MLADPSAAFPTVGRLLREQVIGRLDITQDKLADALKVSRLTVNQLINDKRAVTPEMALRLAKVLGTTPDLWLNLQREVDLAKARERLAGELASMPVLRGALRPLARLDYLISPNAD